MARTPTTPQPRVSPSTPRRSAPPAPRPAGEPPRANGYSGPPGNGPGPQPVPPVHVMPQPPQLLGSDWRLMQDPPQD